MAPDLFDATIRAHAKRTPFTPFKVELLNGESVTVSHPEALVYRAGVAVYIETNSQIHIFDHDGVNRVIAEGQSPVSR